MNDCVNDCVSVYLRERRETFGRGLGRKREKADIIKWVEISKVKDSVGSNGVSISVCVCVCVCVSAFV